MPNIVVMGVAASGKTTLATALAQRLGRRFVEGDEYHSDDNHAKMARGEALTDDDRAPWLDSLADILETYDNTVLSCSALKRSYRDVLRTTNPLFVWLTAPADVLRERLKSRTGHFFDERLLDSQLETLEPPQPNEKFIALDATHPLHENIARVLNRL